MSMTKDEILEQFEEGYDCAQVVFHYWAERLGLDGKTAYKISTGFGAGSFKAKPAVRSSVHIWRSVLNTAPAKKDERAKSSGLQQLLKMCSLGTSYWKNILQQCVKNF